MACNLCARLAGTTLRAGGHIVGGVVGYSQRKSVQSMHLSSSVDNTCRITKQGTKVCSLQTDVVRRS